MDCKPTTRQRKCALGLLANDAAKPLAYGHMGAGGTRRARISPWDGQIPPFQPGQPCETPGLRVYGYRQSVTNCPAL